MSLVEGWNAVLIFCQRREVTRQQSALAALAAFGGQQLDEMRFIRLEQARGEELL